MGLWIYFSLGRVVADSENEHQRVNSKFMAFSYPVTFNHFPAFSRCSSFISRKCHTQRSLTLLRIDVKLINEAAETLRQYINSESVFSRLILKWIVGCNGIGNLFSDFAVIHCKSWHGNNLFKCFPYALCQANSKNVQIISDVS